DIGCGRGQAMMLLASRYPNSMFVGYDLSEEAICFAERETERRSLSNLNFLVKDLSHFHKEAIPQQFDLVTSFDSIHDQARPLNVLSGIARTLRNDGVYFMQDIHGSSDLYGNLDH